MLRFAAAIACAAPLFAAAGHASAEVAPLHLTTAEMLAVEGHGFAPPPYALDPATLSGAWREVALPHALPPQLTPAPVADALGPLTVVTWYRASLPALPALPPSAQRRHLYIPRWKTDGQIAVYGDHKLLYQSHANLQWNGSNHPLWIPLDATAGAAAPKTITLRIERLRGTGGGISTLWLGDEAALGWRYRVRDLLQTQLPLMSSAAFLAVGVFALLVWLRRQGGALYLLFFIMSLASYVRNLHYYAGQQRLPVSDDWFGWLTVNALFWLVATAHFFLLCLHRHARPWLNRMVIGITVAAGIITLPAFAEMVCALWPAAPLPNATVLAPLIYIFLLAMGVTAFVCGFRSARRARSNDGLLLAGWGLLSMLLGVYDWLLQNNLVDIEGSFLGSYASVGIFFIFMAIMLHRYTGALAGIRQANASLEERLWAREQELMQSHARLREIEQRELLSAERQRLTQDMHDGLGSSLVSALHVVESGRLNDVQLGEVLKSCIDDLKLAIDSMEPVDTDLLLLLATLRFRLGPRLESAGIVLRWQVSDVPGLDWLDQRSSLHILRILQEAFTNILKHTHASEIQVSTGAAAGWVTVTIADNGPGFAVAAAAIRGGKGLANQRRRAEALGGTVVLESSAGGTRLTLRLPEQRPPAGPSG